MNFPCFHHLTDELKAMLDLKKILDQSQRQFGHDLHCVLDFILAVEPDLGPEYLYKDNLLES